MVFKFWNNNYGPSHFLIIIIAWNKHEWTSEDMLFQPRKVVNAPNFQIQIHRRTYSPVWFVWRRKMADSALLLVTSPVNQTLILNGNL